MSEGRIQPHANQLIAPAASLFPHNFYPFLQDSSCPTTLNVFCHRQVPSICLESSMNSNDITQHSDARDVGICILAGAEAEPH